MNNWMLAGIAFVIWGGANFFYFRGYAGGMWRIRQDIEKLLVALHLRSRDAESSVAHRKANEFGKL